MGQFFVPFSYASSVMRTEGCMAHVQYAIRFSCSAFDRGVPLPHPSRKIQTLNNEIATIDENRMNFLSTFFIKQSPSL